VLKIKPMITIRDGQVHELAKARTTSKAVAKLKQVARDFAPVESLCVMYSTTPELALEVADDLRDMLPDGTEQFMSRFGPVVGAYAGPGAVGISMLLARDSEQGAGG
jgi:fatty acid-binding protein DegV